MAKTAEHGLRLTKGNFKFRGIVNGVKNKNFYTEQTLSNGTNKRSVNFGVEYAPKCTVYPTVQGFEKPDVYFGKKDETAKKVPWAQRMTFADQHPDWRIIGVNVGLSKGEDGKNISSNMTEFDAASYIKGNLQDGMSVFVQGDLDFRSYVNKNGEARRMVNFNATQVSLCTYEIDFESEKFNPTGANTFEQEIIYSGIEKETDENNKQTGRFILSGYVVSYSAIEPVSFIVKDTDIANKIRKNLKPYSSIVCSGWVEVVHSIEDVQEVDDWGQPIPKEFKKVTAQTTTEMVVGYVDPSTIDTDSFSEEKIAEGIKKLKAKANAKKNYGEVDEQVSVPTADNSVWDEDDWK